MNALNPGLKQAKGAPMLTRLVLKGRTVAPLTDPERRRLEQAVSETRRVRARTLLVRKGEVIDHSTLLLKGLLSRHVDDRLGHRQFLSLQIPGDLVDMHAYPMKKLDHDVGALTDAEVAILPHDNIKKIAEDDPELTRKLWFATLLDGAMHREWIFRLGRLDALGRVAHLFAETGARFEAIGLGTRRRFSLPITHADLGDACGLTSVHVSRVLKGLREDGLCTFNHGDVEVTDYPNLVRRAQFDPEYLYLSPSAAEPSQDR